jgi:hypothetical protein
MHVAQASRLFFLVVLSAATGCQSAPPPAAQPAAAQPPVNPVVGCERTCSTSYDACMNGAQAAAPPNPGAHDTAPSQVQDPVTICQDQLKACFRQCLQ